MGRTFFDAPKKKMRTEPQSESEKTCISPRRPTGVMVRARLSRTRSIQFKSKHRLANAAPMAPPICERLSVQSMHGRQKIRRFVRALDRSTPNLQENLHRPASLRPRPRQARRTRVRSVAWQVQRRARRRCGRSKCAHSASSRPVVISAGSAAGRSGRRS